MVLRDTLGRAVRFCAKNTKFNTSSPKKRYKKKLKKKIFPRKVPLVALISGLKTLTNFWLRVQIFLSLFHFLHFFCNKGLFRLLFWTSRSQIGSFFFGFLTKKRTSINSHVFKKLQKVKKNQFTSKCTLDRLKRLLKKLLKKIARSAKNFHSNYGKFQKRKILAKK